MDPVEWFHNEPSAQQTAARRFLAWMRWIGPRRAAVAVLLAGGVLLGGRWLLDAPAPAVERSLPYTSRAGSGTSSVPVIGKDDTPSTEVSVPSSGPTSLLVHVAGRVAHPGLVRLTQGSRVADAVAAAGGPVDGADVDSLNLAAPLADGQRVYVPALGEVVDPTQGVGGSSGPVVRIDLNSATIRTRRPQSSNAGKTQAESIQTVRRG